MIGGSWFVALSGVVMTLAAPVAAFLLAWQPRGRARLQDRFGWWRVPRGSYVWFHGASAGEMRGLVPVVREWRRRNPGDRILVTTTTITGHEPVLGLADELRLLPFDSPLFLWLALGSIEVHLFVATETELWPSLLALLESRNIPRCLINGRISQRSFPRYQVIRGIIASTLTRYQWIATGDRESHERFLALGARQESTEFVGNTKFDVERAEPSSECEPFWDAYHADSRTTIVLGCIRPDEELWWFDAVKSHLPEQSAFRLVVAPRHREKFSYFAEKLTEAGIPFCRRSSGHYDSDASVVLLDQFGELAQAYRGATLSFIGATLVPLGGHNPLEAAAWGSFVVVGPSFDTYEPIVRSLEAAGAGGVVRTAEEVASIVGEAVTNGAGMRTRGAAGVAVWRAQQGATGRIVERLCELRAPVARA